MKPTNRKALSRSGARLLSVSPAKPDADCRLNYSREEINTTAVDLVITPNGIKTRQKQVQEPGEWGEGGIV